MTAIDLFPYLIYLATLVALFAILGLSYNLLAGFTGLGNLGHPALFLVGAYATALLTRNADLNPYLAWLMGAVAAMTVGGLLSLITRKARGDVVSVLTLFFLFVTVIIALNWTALTRGALGVPGIARPHPFASQGGFFILSLIALALVYAFLRRLVASPFGRVLGAVRDDELAAATLGKNVFRARLIAFLVSGAIAGLGGGLYAFTFRFIDPGSFYFLMLTALLAIVYVGGLASLPGTMLGAALVVLIPELLRFLPFDPEAVGALRQLVFSALVLLVIVWRPKGILGKVEI